jgi:hypothetical protein
MERSLTKTLARKYRISVPQVYRRYRAVLETEHGPRRGLQVTVDRDGKPPLVAQWGGISLARDTTPRPLNDDPARVWSARSEILQRLIADECELEPVPAGQERFLPRLANTLSAMGALSVCCRYYLPRPIEDRALG